GKSASFPYIQKIDRSRLKKRIFSEQTDQCAQEMRDWNGNATEPVYRSKQRSPSPGLKSNLHKISDDAANINPFHRPISLNFLLARGAERTGNEEGIEKPRKPSVLRK